MNKTSKILIGILLAELLGVAYFGGTGKFLGGNTTGGAGGVKFLSKLLDTNVASPSNGQLLVYNSSKWTNTTTVPYFTSPLVVGGTATTTIYGNGSVSTFLSGISQTTALTNATPGLNLVYTQSGTDSVARNGLNLSLTSSGAYTSGVVNGLSFDVTARSTGVGWVTDGVYGMRPAGARGSGGFSRGTPATGGVNTGVLGVGVNAVTNLGVLGTATVAKASGSNIGVMGLGRNTGAGGIEVGGWFGLENVSSNPVIGATSAALVADNGGTTSNIFNALNDGVAQFFVTDAGRTVTKSGVGFNYTTTTTFPYTVLTTDYVIGVGDAVTRVINLPQISTLNIPTGTAAYIMVKDIAGTAGINNITINAYSGQTIDGATSITLNANHSNVTLFAPSGSTTWFIF